MGLMSGVITCGSSVWCLCACPDVVGDGDCSCKHEGGVGDGDCSGSVSVLCEVQISGDGLDSIQRVCGGDSTFFFFFFFFFCVVGLVVGWMLRCDGRR